MNLLQRIASLISLTKVILRIKNEKPKEKRSLKNQSIVIFLLSISEIKLLMNKCQEYVEIVENLTPSLYTQFSIAFNHLKERLSTGIFILRLSLSPFIYKVLFMTLKYVIETPGRAESPSIDHHMDGSETNKSSAPKVDSDFDADTDVDTDYEEN